MPRDLKEKTLESKALMAATIDGDERVIATAQRIVKSLGSNKDITKDMILILSNFDNRLSTMSDLIKPDETAKTLSRLDSSKKLILRWNTNLHDSLPWEESPDDAADYLRAVDDILRLTEDLAIDGDAGGEAAGETLEHAETLLQLAMSRLEEEFRHLLIQNTIPLDSDRLYCSIRRVSLSFASDMGETETVDDFESSVDEDRESGVDRESGDRGSLSAAAVASVDEDLSVELIHPDAVNDLRMIADRMLRSGYEKECCQVYSSVRRDVLDECLAILGVDRMSIEEVQRIEWKALDEKMKKWVRAVKVMIRVLLPGEKHLCEQVFGDSDLIREVCFAETAKGCLMQLLNFGEAVAIGRRSSEKLFRILDMYDALSGAMPDLQALFPDESGDFICTEAEGILKGLGEAACGTFAEFESAVQKETSRKPMQGGEIHPLTRYVMNYVRLLVDYSDSLNLLLGDDDKDGTARQEGNDADECMDGISPVGCRLVSLIAMLESNLEEKSKLYEDGAMQYIFLMNNILYIVQKVKDSELGTLLGDRWVRKRRGQVRQYATGYLRASWTKVLSCLKDEGLGGGGSSSNVSKVLLKDRFKNFNLAFEDIYRTQTVWKVPDLQLREELRLSISDKVIPAYRSFMGRFGGQLESSRNAGKYIKYTAEDMEKLLLDLFEGFPGQLNHPRRKLST